VKAWLWLVSGRSNSRWNWDEVLTAKTPLTAIEGKLHGGQFHSPPIRLDGRKTISYTARHLTEIGAESVRAQKNSRGFRYGSCIASDWGKALSLAAIALQSAINSIVVDDRFSSDSSTTKLSTRKK